jgi:prepilin-type N-terminal cleavage/methylation domain-containing protein
MKNARASGFTLIELILVMAILTMVFSLSAPALTRFFHGRSLDSEARRILALTHGGQSRAASEGIPIDLWFNPDAGEYGLEAEPSYQDSDPHAVEFTLDKGLQLELAQPKPAPAAAPLALGQTPSVVSIPQVKLAHPTLPTIRFLPDGTIAPSSPPKLRILGRDGSSLWLVQTTDKLSYEIRNQDQ